MRLVWFRNDLRLADNPALRHACAGDEPVAALFIVSPTQWQTHKLAPVRQRFMLAQVDAMGRELAALQAAAFTPVSLGARVLRCEDSNPVRGYLERTLPNTYPQEFEQP